MSDNSTANMSKALGGGKKRLDSPSPQRRPLSANKHGMGHMRQPSLADFTNQLSALSEQAEAENSGVTPSSK